MKAHLLAYMATSGLLVAVVRRQVAFRWDRLEDSHIQFRPWQSLFLELFYP